MKINRGFLGLVHWYCDLQYTLTLDFVELENHLHNAEAQRFWMRKGKSDNRGNVSVPLVHASRES